jgi:hypothetical protein
MMSRAYTSRSSTLEFLWALSKHLKSILNENAFTSHVYCISCVLHPGQCINQSNYGATFDSLLLLFGFSREGYQMTSFLELLVIKDAIGDKAINIISLEIILLEKSG